MGGNDPPCNVNKIKKFYVFFMGIINYLLERQLKHFANCLDSLGCNLFEFDMTRSSLTRLLKRDGVNCLEDFSTEQNGTSPSSQPKKFKDYDPEYIHVDIKFLSMMSNDPPKRYLLVAIDRVAG